jgi:large subunit ribosomal protein L29
MAIMRKKELRKMERKDIDKKVGEMRLEMAKERASIKVGANVTSPGRIKEIRRTIARASTIKREKINTEEKK